MSMPERTDSRKPELFLVGVPGGVSLAPFFNENVAARNFPVLSSRKLLYNAYIVITKFHRVSFF